MVMFSGQGPAHPQPTFRPPRAGLTCEPMDSHSESARQAVATDAAPAALGPYSQAIIAGGFVFCSGTVGVDPQTGQVAEGIEAQTEQALRNISAILNAAGASMADLVKTTIFYADVDDFAKLNEVYSRYMPDPPPARSAPANVKLPRGLLVSIEAIALLPTG
jgi:2-iminobutanoate/2-iminopropanoate deaminase